MHRTKRQKDLWSNLELIIFGKSGYDIDHIIKTYLEQIDLILIYKRFRNQEAVHAWFEENQIWKRMLTRVVRDPYRYTKLALFVSGPYDDYITVSRMPRDQVEAEYNNYPINDVWLVFSFWIARICAREINDYEIPNNVEVAILSKYGVRYQKEEPTFYNSISIVVKHRAFNDLLNEIYVVFSEKHDLNRQLAEYSGNSYRHFIKPIYRLFQEGYVIEEVDGSKLSDDYGIEDGISQRINI